MTQKTDIIKRLRRGWCTPLQALQDCGTMKLSTRVGEIRTELFGTCYDVKDRWNEDGGKRFKSYRIVKVKN
jgi:hypothetical protein